LLDLTIDDASRQGAAIENQNFVRSDMRHEFALKDPKTLWTAGAVAALAVAAGACAVTVAARRRPRGHAKRRPDMPTLAGGRGSRVERTVTVLRSPDELYERWRDLAHLPELMTHLETVTPLDDRRSLWTARGPADIPFTWEAEIVADEPGRLIAWRSVAGAEVDNAGSVRFTPAPGGRGTEVKVVLTYAPPAGRLGTAVATMLGRSGDQEVREDLRRFKQRMEADEIATAARRPEEEW
jgi:uncharacterized membrane protein